MGSRRHAQSLMEKHPKDGEPTGHRHHNFTIELFLDEMGGASNIFIDHGQSGEKENLTSWEPEKLIDFIARHTGLKAAAPAPEELGIHRKHASKTTSVDPLSEPAPRTRHIPPSTAGELEIAPHVRDLKVVSVDPDRPGYVLRQGQPFTVCLTLDPAEIAVSGKFPLVCKATISARQLGGPRQTVGEARKKIETSKVTTINVSSAGLPQGMYRLEALVRLAPAAAEHGSQSSPVAHLEGGDLVEVY